MYPPPAFLSPEYRSELRIKAIDGSHSRLHVRPRNQKLLRGFDDHLIVFELNKSFGGNEAKRQNGGETSQQMHRSIVLTAYFRTEPIPTLLPTGRTKRLTPILFTILQWRRTNLIRAYMRETILRFLSTVRSARNTGEQDTLI